MRLVTAVAMILTVSPALAAGGTLDRLSPSWTSLPTARFSAWDRAPAVRVAAVHAAAIPDGPLSQAFVSAANTAERRDLAIDELAAGWEPARRAALEDLRDAQRAYAAAAGGDRDVRGQRFVALLGQVVDGSGRSVAQDSSPTADAVLNQVYDRTLRDVSDDKLATIEASETAWIAYRDAFDRFAMAMDRPDAAKMVHDDLARRRADELRMEASR